MSNNNLILISRSLIAEDCLITVGDVLVRNLDNRWRFAPKEKIQGQQRGRVTDSDQSSITISLFSN